MDGDLSQTHTIYVLNPRRVVVAFRDPTPYQPSPETRNPKSRGRVLVYTQNPDPKTENPRNPETENRKPKSETEKSRTGLFPKEPLHSRLDTRNPTTETRTPRPENRNPEPEIRHPKPDTRNWKPETRNPKPEIRNPKPEIRHPRPEPRNPKPETRNPESETQNSLRRGWSFCKATSGDLCAFANRMVKQRVHSMGYEGSFPFCKSKHM